MLKQGTFLDSHGIEYTVYEQVTGNFRRLDFCVDGANFHTNPAAVRFSLVKQKDTYLYGDRDIYQEFTTLLSVSQQFHVKGQVTQEWKVGKYYRTEVRSLPGSQFLEETVLCNGKEFSYTIQFGNLLYTTSVYSDYTASKYVPLNFQDYEKVTLSSEDVSHSTAPYYSLSVLQTRHDIAHLLDCDFVVADTQEVAQERLKRWLDADVPMKGVDTETTGTNFTVLQSDKLVGIILSYRYGEATYFPFNHQKFDNLSNEFLHGVLMPAIQKEEGRLVAHNKKFERKVFLSIHWNIHIKYDTFPLSFMVNPVIERGAHTLKDLMFRATGKKFLELEDIFVSSKLIDFSVLPKEIVRLYACPDASSILFLYDYLWKQLPVYSRNITLVEYDLADVKADQEFYGLRVDVEKFNKNMENCDYVLSVLMKAFRALTGIDGNINSADVLIDLIYGKMGCPVLARTKTGKPATSAASIKKLASVKLDKPRDVVIEGGIPDLFGNIIIKESDLNTAKYPALLILEKYRIYNKYRTAFYNRFERTSAGGRVFFWVNQNGAASGRQSSPMHQLPPELKDIIIADTPEHDMWDPDYSQIELRMIAFLSGEKELIELCADPENDIHRAIGSLISHKEMWQISSEERKIGKRRNFGVVYMISPHGLALQMAGPGCTKEDVAFASKSLDDFYNQFKRIKKYIAQNAEKVKNQGYLTTYFGRNRYFKEIFDPDITSRKKASLVRQANNLPVQGTAADYLKLAETNFATYIHNKGWDEILPSGFPRVRVALSIHDEVLLMADRSIPYEEIILMIRTCMEMPIEGAPPFFCAPALVDTWAQHDDDSVAMPVNLRDKLIADYQRTGVSVLNRQNYRQTLNTYRDTVLHDYMRGLIKTYGTDPAAVAEHVRHPSLTHELISRYPAPKGSGLDHEGCIYYATEKYIQGEAVTTEVEAEPERVLEDIDQLQTLVNFDERGNVIYEAGEAADDVVEDFYDDEEFVSQLTTGEKVYVWELMDALCIDITGLDDNACNAVIKKVWEHRVEDGFYKIMFIQGDRLLDGRFRIEDIDRIELTDYIKEAHAHGV